MSGKYALIIGNTEYTDPGLAKLTAPGKDAEDFARVLKDPDICAFDDVKVLLDQAYPVIREAIDEFFDEKKPNDLLILYFSGHGVRDEFGTLYLTAKNTNRSRLRSTAIKSDFIHETMDQSRSKRQVLILDCCNSGAFPQGTKAEVGGVMGMGTAFQGYGRFVLTASDSTQFAWEGNKVIGKTDNSLFTHFLVQGLEGNADRDGDGKITVDELYDYAYEQVKLSTPKQTPSKFSSKQQGEIILRQNIRIEEAIPMPLPDDLIAATNSSLTYVREGAVRQLEELLKGKNLRLAHSARAALEKISKEDDSRHVSQMAADILERIQEEESLAAERAEREEAEKEAKKKEERERLEREEKARKGKEAGVLHYEGMLAQEEGKYDEAERLFRQCLAIAIDLKDEQGKTTIQQQLAILAQDRRAKEKAEREAAERAATEKAERDATERAAKEKAEHEAAERAATEKAERDATERAAKEKAEREAAEKVAREKAKCEAAERSTKEKADREAAEKAAKEKAKREAAEKTKREAAEKARKEKIAIRLGWGIVGGIITIVGCMWLGLVFSNPTGTEDYPEEPAAEEPVIEEPIETPTPKPTHTQSPTPIPPTPTITPYPQEITDSIGAKMRFVPAGEFIMGFDAEEACSICKKYTKSCSTSDCQAVSDEEPIHSVFLDSFYIDKYEITNALYRTCVNAGICQPPTSGASYTHTSYYSNSKYDNYPVIFVDWYRARTFCEWRGMQLPSEAQWEKAARGADGRTYPWGNDFDGIRVNLCDRNCTFDWALWSLSTYDDGYSDTAPVGSYGSGVSPYGVYNMGGNVKEWVSSLYMPYPYDPTDGREDNTMTEARVIRGGSWANAVGGVRGTNRDGKDPDFTHDYIGFRCLKLITRP